jgi:ABC-type amino acid transport substrate-binding protein
VSRSFAFLICLFINFSSSAQTIPELTTADLMKLCPEIKVGGGEWLNPRFLESYQDTATGAGIELLIKIELHLGPKLILMPETPFSRQLLQLEKCELDVVVGLYNIEMRREKFLLSDSYFQEKLYVYALHDTFLPPVDLSTLAKRIGGIRRGASYGDELDKFFSDRKHPVVIVNESQQIAKLLIMKRIDYYVGAGTIEHELVYISKNIARLNVIDTQKASLAMSKESVCNLWLPRINQIIRQTNSSF